MSIDNDCGIMVGLPYEMIDLENLDDLINDGELDISSQYYDSWNRENIVGFWAYYGDQSEIEPSEFSDEIKKARQKFLEIIDLEPKVYLVLDIT